MHFLGVDLAWKDGNSSGVALLTGRSFPLALAENPGTIDSHQAVLEWIGPRVARHAAMVGVDAPLLGLAGGRRRCDNEVSSAFGRFHASTHSPSQMPALDRFAETLEVTYGIDSFGPHPAPRPRCPVIREVYPNALQVRLFDLDGAPGLHILKYKRRRFPNQREWAERGLAEFVRRTEQAIAGRYVSDTPAWSALIADRPRPGRSGRELKSIENRWDAVLCALAVALEFLGPPGCMRFYPDEPDAWRSGFILAPCLASARPPRLVSSAPRRPAQSLMPIASRPTGSIRARRS